MRYLTEPLNSRHDRDNFSCGKDLLDYYFKKLAGQDIKRKLSACFVLVDKKTDLISGYYTLSSNSISINLIPDFYKKKLPKSYMSIPTILLGRLAINKDFQNSLGGVYLSRLSLSYKPLKNMFININYFNNKNYNWYDDYFFSRYGGY